MDEVSRIERSLCFSDDKKVEKRPNKRVMIAHAGLQRWLIEVNKLKQLRYRRDVSEIVKRGF